MYKRVRFLRYTHAQIADLFPEDGWVNTTHVSREYGAMKKRRDREDAMEDDAL